MVNYTNFQLIGHVGQFGWFNNKETIYDPREGPYNVCSTNSKNTKSTISTL